VNVNCYNCGSNQKEDYAEENGYLLKKCSNCGLLYVVNRPDNDQINESHRQGKHRGEAEIDVTGRFSQLKVDNYKLVLNDLFGSEKPQKGKWLDVGCGHGEFLLAIQGFSNNNIEVIGSEPNLNKQATAKSKGLKVDFIDLDNHHSKYNFISLLNVYSHVPDPPAFIKQLSHLLLPDGELILQTGDTANLSAKDHYKPFDLPDHLSFASEEIVTSILKRTGFEILNISKYPFVILSFKQFLKEFLKLFLPKYKSVFKYYFNWKKYQSTDMYIRAKFKG